MSRSVRFLLLIGLLIGAVSALRPEQVTSPRLGGRDHWVSDPDGYITSNEVFQLNRLMNSDSKLFDHRNRVACDSVERPFQVGVAVVTRMEGRLRHAPVDFARRVFDLWGLGYPECGNGALLFVSLEDRQSVIVHGPGAISQILTDSVIESIIDTMSPDLRQGRLYHGLHRGSSQLVDTLVVHAPQFQLPIVTPSGVVGAMLVLTVALMFFGTVVWFVSPSQRTYYSWPRRVCYFSPFYWNYYWSLPVIPPPPHQSYEISVRPLPNEQPRWDQSGLRRRRTPTPAAPAGGQSSDGRAKSWDTPPTSHPPTAAPPPTVIDVPAGGQSSGGRAKSWDPMPKTTPSVPLPTVEETVEDTPIEPAGGESARGRGKSWDDTRNLQSWFTDPIRPPPPISRPTTRSMTQNPSPPPTPPPAAESTDDRRDNSPKGGVSTGGRAGGW